MKEEGTVVKLLFEKGVPYGPDVVGKEKLLLRE